MMNKLAFLALAATPFISAGALAQPMPPTAESYEEGDYHRIEHGMVVPSRWWSPNYVIVDWGGYGLSQPGHGHRWVRYYDDALLIDEQGRVVDSRYGMDWGRWAAAWNYDADGVPVLIGGGGHVYAGHHGPGVTTKRYFHPAYGHGGHAYAAQGYGYGHGYYGAAYGGAWVTETTVTYSDCCCEAAEEVVYEQPPVYTPPPPPPPPPPMPGERG